MVASVEYLLVAVIVICIVCELETSNLEVFPNTFNCLCPIKFHRKAPVPESLF